MAKKKKKRKKSSAPVVRMSPAKYIRTQARQLPIYECHMAENWQEAGLATVIVARQRPSGNLVAGVYLVDTFCLGVKKVHCEYNMTSWEYQELVERAGSAQDLVVCDYAMAHNLIYGGIAYAEELGFRPPADFDRVAAYVLKEDDDRVEFIDLEFGRDGEPVLFVTPSMKPARYIRQLNESVGEGNYHVVYQDDDWEEDDDEFPPLDTERPFRQLISTYAERMRENYAEQHGTDNLALSNMEIVYEPMEMEYDQHYADELDTMQEVMTELHEQVNEDAEAALPGIREAVARYPKHPVFQNYLYLALRKTEQPDEADSLARRMYEEFPEYLYAKIGYADSLLKAGQLDEVAAVFDDKYVLSFVYPDRTQFHYTEIVAFNSFMARYFLERGELDRAASQCSLMFAIAEDHPQTEAIEQLVGMALMQDRLDKLQEETPEPDDTDG